MPIGGTGQRFKKAGFKEPKPLIPLNGKPLIQHVLECYPTDADLFIIARKEFARELTELLDRHVIVIDHITKGPVETVFFLGEKILRNLGEILIADCDSLISPTEISDAIQIFMAVEADGGVTTRITDNPACSYAKIEDGWITETREKDPFTKYSTTGPYWWKSAKDFLECGRLAMRDGQFHISPCYNYLIRQGKKVKAFPVSTSIHLGTPEELSTYNSRFNLQPR